MFSDETERKLEKWIYDLWHLETRVATWAANLGWESWVVMVPLKDSKFGGDYLAPGLVLVKNGCTLKLNPYGRHLGGTDGGGVDFWKVPMKPEALDELERIGYVQEDEGRVENTWLFLQHSSTGETHWIGHNMDAGREREYMLLDAKSIGPLLEMLASY